MHQLSIEKKKMRFWFLKYLFLKKDWFCLLCRREKRKRKEIKLFLFIFWFSIPELLLRNLLSGHFFLKLVLYNLDFFQNKSNCGKTLNSSLTYAAIRSVAYWDFPIVFCLFSGNFYMWLNFNKRTECFSLWLVQGIYIQYHQQRGLITINNFMPINNKQ